MVISSAWKFTCFKAALFLWLNLPNAINGRSLLKIHDSEDTNTVNLPDGSANAVFFSIQGSLAGSCDGAELYFFLNQKLSEMVHIKLYSLGSGDSHVFNVTFGGKNQIATLPSQTLEYFYLSINCLSPIHYRLYLEDGRLSLRDIVATLLWESEYFEGMNTIHSVMVEKNTPADPLYSMVVPFALPLVRAFNITNNWENHELYQLFDLDYSGETCIKAYPESGRSWILKIRIPLLTGYYHGNHTSVIITGDFMECDDPIKTMVSTVNNEKGLPGKMYPKTIAGLTIFHNQ